MKKITVYGLPLNPRPLLDQLTDASFCVSYATRERLGSQLDDAISLTNADGILLVDNGAFSHFKSGGSMTPDYVAGFERWAQSILDRCPQAIAVLPDVIGGTEEQNVELINTTALDTDRCMAIWHLNESIEFLLYLCESFNWIGFGSAGEYWQPGTEKWHARMREAFAAIEAWERESEGAYIRPRIHLMRAQAFAHLHPVDSSDSTNVAMNHNRQLKKSGETVAAFAGRIDRTIQASAGPEADHQVKRPLLDHLEMKRARWEWAALPNEATEEPHPLDIPDFLKRAA
jgi:hypothetical protein